MFYQICLLSKGKQSKIISNKHGICDVCHEISNDLRLRILENEGSSGKFYNFIE